MLSYSSSNIQPLLAPIAGLKGQRLLAIPNAMLQWHSDMNADESSTPARKDKLLSNVTAIAANKSVAMCWYKSGWLR
jgi:hypothetical protein